MMLERIMKEVQFSVRLFVSYHVLELEDFCCTSHLNLRGKNKRETCLLVC